MWNWILQNMCSCSSPARHWPTGLPHLTQSHLSCMERQKQAAGQCLQSDSFQMDLFARSVTSSGPQSVHRSISFANKSLPAKTLTIASKQRVSQTWCDSGTKWVPSCANPLTRQDLEQSCKHCFGNVPLERCVMGCSKSARQLR